MPMSIEAHRVDGCATCPLRNPVMNVCRHPRVEFTLRCLDSILDLSPPEECPLRTHTLVLSFADNGGECEH